MMKIIVYLKNITSNKGLLKYKKSVNNVYIMLIFTFTNLV